MKFSLATAIVGLMVTLAHAADPVTTTNVVLPPSPQVAIEAITKDALPHGVSLTGSTEIIPPPSKADTSSKEATTPTTVVAHEQFLGGWGAGGLGWNGWGGWSGFGGLGPYRFGYSCGGLGGWAYPLGYWNAFGSGVFGGSCGLGIPFGGLFYC